MSDSDYDNEKGLSPEIIELPNGYEKFDEYYIESTSDSGGSMDISNIYDDFIAEANLNKGIIPWTVFKQYKPYRLYSVDSISIKDRTFVACGGSKNHSLIWDLETCTQVAELKGTYDLQFFFFAPFTHKSRHVYLNNFKAHEDSVTFIRFSPSGDLLACGGIDGTLFVYDTLTAKEIAPKRNFSSGIIEVF